jgi:hypothetical protein
MKVAERSPVPYGRAALAGLAILAAFVAQGCRPEPKPLQRTIAQQADSNYEFGPAREAVNITDPAYPGTVTAGLPRYPMRIATATLKPGRPPTADRIIALITSDGDYAPLGIAKGRNYVWRNSRDTAQKATWITKVVPADSAKPDYVLHRDARHREYTSGNPAEPRLVQVTVASYAFDLCLDDPACPTMHCGYW